MSPVLIFETAKIVGNPSGRCWAQTHTFSPEDRGKQEKRGSLLAALVITGAPEGIGAVSLGREILGRLHEEYYGNLAGSAFEGLRNAVKKVGLEYEGTEIVAASVLGNILYLAILGEGKFLLKRKEEIGWLLEGEENLRISSGIIQEGDLLLLGSAHFFRVVSNGVLKAALETNSPVEAEESLAPVILGREDIADAVCILALFKKASEDLLIKNVASEESLPGVMIEKKEKIRGNFLNRLKRLPFFKPREIRIRSTTISAKKKFYFLASLLLLLALSAALVVGFKKRKSQKPAVISPLVQPVVEEKKNENEIVLSKVPLFYDLSLISDKASGSEVVLSGRSMLILDSQNSKIYQLDLEKKSFETVGLASDSGKFLTNLAGKPYLLGSKGVYEVNLPKKEVTLKVSKDDSWKEIIGLSSFGNNLYLLDRGSRAIWRYPGKTDGFGPKSNWFVGSLPDLTKVDSFAIDGSVWLLGEGEISKFVLGKKDNFSLTKMTESLRETVKIYTSDKEKNLYILDESRGKIFVIDKSGEFKNSYVWEGIKQTTDFAVSEPTKKIFLLSGTKIYEIEMK